MYEENVEAPWVQVLSGHIIRSFEHVSVFWNIVFLKKQLLILIKLNIRNGDLSMQCVSRFCIIVCMI